METNDIQYLLKNYARNTTSIVRGNNATLFDEHNKDYIDFSSGIGVVSVGHANEIVNDAICKQISQITHTSNLYTIQPQIALAKKISSLAGSFMGAFFCNSGAEANEAAIKLARKYGNQSLKKRYKIITLEHSFHGRTLAALRATGQSKFHTQDFAPYPEGFLFVSSVDEIYNAIDDECVAVMLELIQGEGGVCSLDKESMHKLALFLKERDILLIVDEIQTGIFRTGEFLASQVFGIEPDIITLAKGLGNGVPIGAMITKLHDVFVPGDHGSTFGGNYLVSAAALSVLNILEGLYANKKLAATIAYFEEKLAAFYHAYPDYFCALTGIGLMRGLQCKDDTLLSALVAKALENGVIVLKSGRSTLRFLPPLTITKQEIDEGFKRLYAAF